MLLIYCICWMAEDRFQCAQCRKIVKSKTIINKPLYLQLYMYPKKKHSSCPPSGYHSSSKNRFFRHPNGFIIQIIQRSKLQTLVLDGFFNNPKSHDNPSSNPGSGCAVGVTAGQGRVDFVFFHEKSYLI